MAGMVADTFFGIAALKFSDNFMAAHNLCLHRNGLNRPLKNPEQLLRIEAIIPYKGLKVKFL